MTIEPVDLVTQRTLPVVSCGFIFAFLTFFLINTDTAHTLKALSVLLFILFLLVDGATLSGFYTDNYIFLLSVAFFSWICLSSVLQEFITPRYYYVFVEQRGLLGIWNVALKLPVWSLFFIVGMHYVSLDSSAINIDVSVLSTIFLGWIALGGVVGFFVISGNSSTDYITLWGLNRNHSSIIMNGLIPFLCAGLVRWTHPFWRRVGYGIFGLSVLTIVLTQSRTGVIGLLTVLGIFCGGHYYKTNRLDFAGNCLIITFCGFTLGLMTPAGDRMIARFVDPDALYTLGERVFSIWPATLFLISESFLYGHAVGTYPYQITHRIDYAYPYAHSTYFQILFDGGLVAFGMFVAICIMTIKRAYRGAKQADSKTSIHNLALLTAFVGVIFIQGIVEFVSYELLAILISFYFLTNSLNSPSTGDAA